MLATHIRMAECRSVICDPNGPGRPGSIADANDRALLFDEVTEDVRKYAAEHGIAEDEVLKKGMEAKSKEFIEKGAEIYEAV